MLSRNPDAREIAVVIGGSISVDRETSQTADLLAGSGCLPTYFVTNDKIMTFDHIDHAVTLHPSKLPRWLLVRRCNRLQPPGRIWAFRKFQEYPQVTDATNHWQGSSGLFAVKIARELGFSKIILCGVPISAEAKHFMRPGEWRGETSFRSKWLMHKDELMPYVRSWSGWTAELFGMPSKEWTADNVPAL